MIKKVILSAFLFIFIFLATLWATLPYENFISKGLAEAQKQAKISITYDSLKSSPLKTVINDFSVNDLPIGNLETYHMPLSLVMSSNYKVSGAVNAKGKISLSSITFNGDVSSGLINALSDMVRASGNITADIDAGFKDGTGEISASADKLGFKTPIGMMDFQKVTLKASMKDNRVTIEELKSDDDMALNLKGQVTLNKRNLNASAVNISGTFSFVGQEKKITLKGRLNNIKPSVR